MSPTDPSAPVRVIALHKPRGVIASTIREGGSTTAYELLPEAYRDWFCVGRLDKESEGLLLFCNDARTAQRLMDPGDLAKTYLVTVIGLPRDADLEVMRRGGLIVDGRALRPIAVRRTGKAPRGGTRLEVVLHEGRNRQIRRLFHASGFKVRRLVRFAIGPIDLGDLPAGATRELSAEQTRLLLAPLGPSTDKAPRTPRPRRFP